MKAIHGHQGLLADIASLVAGSIAIICRNCKIGSGIGQLTHTEGVGPHHLLSAFVAGHYLNLQVLAHSGRAGHKMTIATRLEGTVRNGGRYLAAGDTGNAHAHRIIVTCIEDVHDVGTHRGTRSHYRIFLGEIAPHSFAVGAGHLQITRAAAHSFKEAIVGLYPLTTHIDGGTAGGVHSGHDNLCTETSSLHHGLRTRYHIGLQLVYANVLHVHIAHQIVKHFTLGITYVALQFSEQRDGCSRRCIFKHIFLPVLSQCSSLARHIGVEIAADNATFGRVGDHVHNAVAVAVDCIVELAATATLGCQHHLGTGLQVLAITDIVDIALLAITLLHDSHLEVLGQLIERIAHATHMLCLVVPLLHLGRIGLHLRLQTSIDALVGGCGIGRGAVEAFLHQREAIEYIAGDIERQHGHQHQIHEVDHLLAGGNAFFSDWHRW